MQLMPRTASALGVRDPFDPRENIRGGVRHLAISAHVMGERRQAVAATMPGEGAVDFHEEPPVP
jgi:soluble lytic murein transglycosylase-like protein